MRDLEAGSAAPGSFSYACGGGIIPSREQFQKLFLTQCASVNSLWWVVVDIIARGPALRLLRYSVEFSIDSIVLSDSYPTRGLNHMLYAKKALPVLSLFALCFCMSGCADGTLEVKVKPTPTTVVERTVVVPAPTPVTRETTRTQTTTNNGDTVRTTETKSTTR